MKKGRRRDLQVPDSILDLRKSLLWEILPEETSYESQRQEDNRHGRQLLHALILACRNGVEDEVDQVVARLLQLLQAFRDDDTVIEHVAEVRMRHGRDDDAGGRILEFLHGAVLGHVGLVIAEDVDKVVDGVEKGEHLVDFGYADVKTPTLVHRRRSQNIELEVADYVSVYGCQWNSEVDNSVNNGLHQERAIVGLPQDCARCAETGDDGPLYVAGGDFEKGDDSVVGG